MLERRGTIRPILIELLLALPLHLLEVGVFRASNDAATIIPLQAFVDDACASLASCAVFLLLGLYDKCGWCMLCVLMQYKFRSQGNPLANIKMSAHPGGSNIQIPNHTDMYDIMEGWWSNLC